MRMELHIRALTEAERKYTYKQSTQLEGQTGSIGYLRGDFGKHGNEFYTTWFDIRPIWKSEAFQSELDEVITALRSDEYGLLKDSATMNHFGRAQDDSIFEGNYCTEFGFRVDTERHSFLLRCNPTKGDYNFVCHCFVKELLDHHMMNAERGIRFITPNYREIFRIPDGDKILITYPDGETRRRTARYIDEYHVEIGSNLFHICEFAERMQGANAKVIPLRSSLPERCYVYLATENVIGIVHKGEHGYYKTDFVPESREEGKQIVDGYNRNLGIPKRQSAAMVAGSMFGWETPAADPNSYDENGNAIRPRHWDREAR